MFSAIVKPIRACILYFLKGSRDMRNEMSEYLFHQGTNYKAYDYLGCNLTRKGKKYLYSFRTWAPNALCVELISDFSGWDSPIPLTRTTDNGIFELIYTSDKSLEGSAYKFRITSYGGVVNKGDPYARFSRGGADGASIIFTDRSFKWGDSAYLAHRAKIVKIADGSYIPAPINIYEVHLGSFMRHDDDSYYTYRELADVLPKYLRKMGYTHVEFLPIQEHPYDGSWGYQVCGFFAPTSRYGNPNDLRFLINTLHRAGIGVIMDWVPAHFPKDEWGLYEFDGSPLYEYQGADRQESRSWGTRFFDLGREEIQSFLVSSALYFLREFHIDGLRVDAVASMIYLDYDRMPGEWIPNPDGTNENREAIAFIKKLNSAVFAEFPEALMIAEESTAFSGITKPVTEGGLGFNLKWNMGWANDFYDYLSTDPVYRKYNHRALNFPILYAFRENYCLPISHDEVVHGKKSFINKMYGSLEDKFSQARTALMLKMTFPGKKLLFMGTEYAQFREWDFESSLEWFMLDYPNHRSFREYVAELNGFYLRSPELWEIDFSERGFSWLLADEADKSSVAYKRYSLSGDSLIVLLNFSGAEQELFLENTKKVYVVFDTGNIPDNFSRISERDGGIAVRLPSFSGMILKEKTDTVVIKI